MLARFNHPYVLLFTSMVIGAILNCLVNYYSKDRVKNAADNAFYSLCASALTACVVAVFIIGDGFNGISLFTLAMSAVFALFTFSNYVIHIKALNLGPLAYTSIISSASSVIPALYGLIFLGEPITVWQITGIILMLVSVFFSVEKEPEKKKASIRWLVWALLNFLTVGAIGICQKIHHASDSAAQLNEYLLLTFIFVFIYSLIYLLILKKKGVTVTSKPFRDKKVMTVLVFAGITTGLVNMLNMFLSGVFDAGLFFPVVNGGTVLATILLSVFLFKEKFSPRRWLGIGFGVLALCFLLGVVQSILGAFGISA